ncbi:MAG: hypothetical protein CL940_07980 [Deltaproteobacteria bacterium]|nr:hypothetical protein [Deltaproteobacteria bacterium]
MLCETNADCSDVERSACEMVICQEEGYCLPLPLGNGTPCDDGNVCTVDELCEAGVCGGGTNDCPCDSDTDCGDKGEGDLCEASLVCIGGGCEPDPAGPVVCEDVEGDCVETACDPATGACVDTPTPDGSACATDNACITGATCMEGACEGGTAVECPGGGPCVTVTCDSKLGCIDTPTNEGEACNDGNPCSTGDTCVEGVCVADGGSCECEVDDDCLPFVSDLCVTEMLCEEGLCVAYDVALPDPVEPGPDGACQEMQCDSATGVWGMGDKPDGTDCSQGLECDTGAACVAGECAVPEGVCDDGNPCTNDGCEEGVGCVYEDIDGGPCDDDNPCTSGDKCVEGSCWPGQDVCMCDTDADCSGEGFDQCLGEWSCDQGACVVKPNTAVDCSGTVLGACEVAACKPETGECYSQAAEDGAACDDGNLCTTGDVCGGGQCGGEPNSCDDGNECTDDSCAPATGCKNIDNSKPCDDNNACTSGDFCISGSCFGGAAVQCTSNIQCTTGVCDPVQGCVAETVSDGTACDDGTECTDDDACFDGVCSGTSVCECLTTADCAASENDDLCDGTLVCVDGACEVDPSTVVACPAAGPCEAGKCIPATGECKFEASNEAASCDAGPCKTLGMCMAGECVGEPVDCDDGQPCTSDKCDLDTGLCVTEAKSGSCDDSDPCTINEACDEGLCTGGLNFPCNDGDPCTSDACEPGVGCTFKPVVCDDDDACTTDSCNAQGACVFEEKICGNDPLNTCQSGYCDENTGECVDGMAPDGTECSDQNACTTGDACQLGVCIAGGIDLCDDDDPCTVDLCSPTTGCSNDPLPCDSDDPCIAASCEDGGCVLTPVDSPVCNGEGVGCNGSNGSSCDDENDGTTADVCIDGLCRGFAKTNLQVAANQGNLRITRVNFASGKWFMAAQIYGGSIGTVNQLLAYDATKPPEDIVNYPETASSQAWTQMHGGFAVHDGGELWRYDPGSGSWSGENALGDTFIENNLIQPQSLWVYKESDKLLRLWAVGLPNDQAFPVLVCSEETLPNGTVEVDCDGQQLDTEYDEELLKAVAGTANCAGSGCTYHRLLGADYPGNQGDYTDVFENYTGYDDAWDYTFNDTQVQAGHTTYDVASLGDESYVIAGGGGYVRHRANNGTLSWLPELKNNQTQRDFRGAWSGAGMVVMAATRNLNSGPDAEIWTANVTSNVTSGESWTVLKLGDLAQGSIIHDVWGDDAGNICVVGEEGSTAVIYRR